jgi:hypothetical protein
LVQVWCAIEVLALCLGNAAAAAVIRRKDQSIQYWQEQAGENNNTDGQDRVSVMGHVITCYMSAISKICAFICVCAADWHACSMPATSVSMQCEQLTNMACVYRSCCFSQPLLTNYTLLLLSAAGLGPRV